MFNKKEIKDLVSEVRCLRERIYELENRNSDLEKYLGVTRMSFEDVSGWMKFNQTQFVKNSDVAIKGRKNR